MARVRFFGALTLTTQGQKETDLAAQTLGELLDKLGARYGDEFRARVLGTNGGLQEHIRIFVENKDARFLGERAAPLSPEAHVTIMPAVGGG